MLAFVAKKKLSASARSFGWPAALAPLSNSSSRTFANWTTCGFPASTRFANSSALRRVPVGRKRTDASLAFAPVLEPGNEVRAVELPPERFAEVQLREAFGREFN